MPSSPKRLVVACMLASLVGGALCTLALHFTLDARAEDPKPKNILRAEGFEIVDSNGNRLGFIGKPGGDAPLGITLNDDKGRPGYSTTLTAGNLTLTCPGPKALPLQKNTVELGEFSGRVPDAEKGVKVGIKVNQVGSDPWFQPQ